MLKRVLQSREIQILSLIIFVGLLLRLIGIKHGFPFIFHPDEPAVVRSATGIRFNPNPAHFDWPHLHFYLNYFVYFIFIKVRGLVQILGLQKTIVSMFPLLWRDPLVFYFISRVFDAFLGAFTAIPLFLAGKRLKNTKTGLIAAAVLAVFPHHVHVSHFALIDVPTVFWISWALYFSTRIFKQYKLSDYILAGLFVGFAASTKYNGGLSAIVVFIAHVLRLIEKKESFFSIDNFKALILSGLFAIFGFVLGTPYSIFDFDTFSRTDSPVGALWQFTNVGSVDMKTRLNQFVLTLTTRFARDYGYTFIAVFTLFTIYTLFRMRKRYALLVFPALFLLFYTAGFEKFRIHYFMTAYPFMIIAIALAISELKEKLPKLLKIVLLLIVFIPPIYLSIDSVIVLKRPDTRVELSYFLMENVTVLDHIVYNSSSILPVIEDFSSDKTHKGVEKDNLETRRGYIVIYTSSLEDLENGEMSESFITSEYELVHTISSYGRRGGDIAIYAFDETKKN